MKVIVSENATEYFKKEGITSSEWVEYCREKFGLKNGDVVFYEGNTIGYIKIQNENIRKH